MAIGINGEYLDDFDDFEGDLSGEENLEGQEEPSYQEQREEDYIDLLLRTKGIVDSLKIKFEDENGELEERSWNELSNEEKFNILNTPEEKDEDDLDDSEIELLNAIRSSGLTPQEFIQNEQRRAIDNFSQNLQQGYEYTVDQYGDDELFVADLITRMPDITEEEAQEALENAKSNEALYRKQINATRQEYKNLEQEQLQLAQYEQELINKLRFDQFAESVADEIGSFTEFSGYDVNLEQSEMQELYDFITGVGADGVNYFAKALSDPKILVQTAWFALNGLLMMDEITLYYLNEITNVRKNSYKKGLEDAKKKSEVVYKPKNGGNNEYYDDLDEF